MTTLGLAIVVILAFILWWMDRPEDTDERHAAYFNEVMKAFHRASVQQKPVE